MGNRRETLKKNQIVTLKGVNSGKSGTFQIRDDEVKEGSSCLVYRALADDNTPIILKELFPRLLSEATRNPDGSICWPVKKSVGEDICVPDKNEKKIAESQKRFSDSIDIMKVISNDVNYKRYIGGDRNIEVLMGNNTLYCVNEDFGKTLIWSDVQRESVLNIMECSLAIAMFLDYLHQKGYVYIDLKPENILLPENGVQQIDYSNPKFFDFDSVLKNGGNYHMSLVHGSPGYIPDYLPNTLSNEILGFTNISYEGPDEYIVVEPKFDVYSLGMILENKINRENMEEVPEDLKPRIVNLYKSMKKQYGCPSMEEVIEELKIFIKELKEQERIREGSRFEKNEERYKKGYPFVMSATILAFLTMTAICIVLGVQSEWVLSHAFARSRATVYLGAVLCVVLTLIIFGIKYASFRLAINKEFSRIANQSYDAGLCNASNYFEYGYDLTVGKKKKQDGIFYRPYLWAILFIMIMAVFIVSVGFSSIPMFLALGFASIIAFMYADYVPKDLYIYESAAKREYSGKFYADVKIKGNEKALFFLEEYNACEKSDIFDLNNPFYKENHLNIYSICRGEEMDHLENLDIHALRDIYKLGWDTLVNTKRIVDLVLLFITLLAVFLDIAVMSAFFTDYFHIPETVFLPLTLLAIIVSGIANIVVVYWDRAYAEEVVYFLFASRYFKENELREHFKQDIENHRILPIYIARGIQLYNEEVYVEGKYQTFRGYIFGERNRFFSNRFLLHHLELEEKRRVTIDIWLGFGILFSVFVWHMHILAMLPVLLIIAALLNYYMYKRGVSLIIRRFMIRKIRNLKNKYPKIFHD